MITPAFVHELTQLINKHSLENNSNTPDYILADYLANCLENADKIINNRNLHICKEQSKPGSVKYLNPDDEELN